jgi:hypothetical protein
MAPLGHRPQSRGKPAEEPAHQAKALPSRPLSRPRRARLAGAPALVDRLCPTRPLRRRLTAAHEADGRRGRGARAVPELAPGQAGGEDQEDQAGEPGDQRIDLGSDRSLQAVQQEISDIAAEPDPVRPLLRERPGREVGGRGQEGERQGEHRQPGPVQGPAQDQAHAPQRQNERDDPRRAADGLHAHVGQAGAEVPERIAAQRAGRVVERRIVGVVAPERERQRDRRDQQADAEQFEEPAAGPAAAVAHLGPEK